MNDQELLEAVEKDEFNAFVHVDHDGFAAAKAASAERSRAGELKSPIDGLTIAVKDNMDVAGLPTGNGSSLFDDAPAATTDARAVGRLRAAGVAILGKTHMTELACGTSGLNPHLGDARNPHNPGHHPGGSSSGSAIAVAAGLAPLALGSDTGGSIRVPAASCGVVGLKPSFGRVSNVGMSVCARNLDHLGPIASSVPLAAQALVHIQNPGWPDTSVDPTFTPELKVAVLTGDFLEHCDPDVVRSFEEGVRLVEQLCYSVTEVDLGIDLAAADEHTNVLGRDLFDIYGAEIASAPDGALGAEFSTWLELYEGVSDDDYAAALAEQRRIMAVVAEQQKTVDVLLCPTLRGGASRLANVAQEPRDRRTGNVALFNLTGQPSLTVPFGTASNGMPLGMLFTGRSGEDELVLTLGTAFEAAQRAS